MHFASVLLLVHAAYGHGPETDNNKQVVADEPELRILVDDLDVREALLPTADLVLALDDELALFLQHT